MKNEHRVLKMLVASYRSPEVTELLRKEVLRRLEYEETPPKERNIPFNSKNLILPSMALNAGEIFPLMRALAHLTVLEEEPPYPFLKEIVSPAFTTALYNLNREYFIHGALIGAVEGAATLGHSGGAWGKNAEPFGRDLHTLIVQKDIPAFPKEYSGMFSSALSNLSSGIVDVCFKAIAQTLVYPIPEPKRDIGDKYPLWMQVTGQCAHTLFGKQDFLSTIRAVLPEPKSEAEEEVVTT